MANIVVDHKEVEKVANAIDTYVSKHKKKMNSINQCVETVGESWKGADYNQFRKEWKEIKGGDSTSSLMIKHLEGHAAFLRFALMENKSSVFLGKLSTPILLITDIQAIRIPVALVSIGQSFGLYLMSILSLIARNIPMKSFVMHSKNTAIKTYRKVYIQIIRLSECLQYWTGELENEHLLN